MIFIGYDEREADAYQVCRSSLLKHVTEPVPIHGLVMEDLRSRGLYWRPTSLKDGRLIDERSIRPDYDGAMSTEFALTRFLVPYLAGSGWALFMDCDMLVRSDISRVFKGLDHSKALYCVHHDYRPKNTEKMNGQSQTAYPRKNWSSFMLFNCDHPANHALTLEYVNTAPGKDLHAFDWLPSHLIGSLCHEWNVLVGHTPEIVIPRVLHYTEGVPSMKGHENDPYADEWRAYL